MSETVSPAVVHQSYNGLPELTAPLTNLDRTITIPWYRFLINIWRLLGGSQLSSINAVYYVNGEESLNTYDITNNYVTTVNTTDQTGAPAQVQTLVSSPFIFTATRSGMLSVGSGKVEFSRDGGTTYYQLGLTGGTPWLLSGDMVKVSWYDPGADNIPTVVWFPISAG